MKQILWQDAFDTGIRVIDDDHKMLFSIVNNLIDEVHQGREGCERQIESLLDALSDYVDSHFAREELFLEQYGYPELNAHRDSHDDLRREIEGIAADYKEDAERIDLRKVCAFLALWLSDHILKSDLAYMPYLSGEKKGDKRAMRRTSQQVTVSIPMGTGNLIHELAHELRHGIDVDSAVRYFADRHFRGDYRKKTFRKTSS